MEHSDYQEFEKKDQGEQTLYQTLRYKFLFFHWKIDLGNQACGPGKSWVWKSKWFILNGFFWNFQSINF